MIRPYFGRDEFINNTKRFCLWLENINLSDIEKSKFVMSRIEETRKFWETSNREATKKLAKTPYLFGEIRQPRKNYLLIPKVSSENRVYIPIGFMHSDMITNGGALIIPDAGLYELGILTSNMHMAWMRYVCGRMKSDYQYSTSIVYNNVLWPEPTVQQHTDIEQATQAVLDARAGHPQASLAELYDPHIMPADLVKAYAKLDKLVEKAYGRSFDRDADRMAFLFEKHQKLSMSLHKTGINNP